MSTKRAEQPIVLVVDDTPANLQLLVDYLPQHGLRVLVARTGERALEQVQHTRPDLILLDVMMPGLNGFETCRQLKADPMTRDIPVIFMTALSETSDKVRGFEAGGVDYVIKPFKHEEVLARVMTHLTLRELQAELAEANERLEQRVAERTTELEQALREVEDLKNRLQAENVYLQEEIRLEHHNFREIVGGSAALLDVLRQVETIAPSDATVLLLGETGTGKELFARALHDRSRRRDRPLVKVNCTAIAAGLVESELFGHVKGAFTGATHHRVGRFELADGGTIFLDEIGELPPEAQVKLLRVLQEREFEPVGSSRTKSVDVRVVAATNRDLAAEVQAGRFRSDLFYRLEVLPLELPPLRARSEDIPALVDSFAEHFARDLGKPIPRIDSESMARLQSYDWPGNVRELRNLIERAMVLATGPTLVIGDLAPTSFRASTAERETDPRAVRSSPSLVTLADNERRHIEASLRLTEGVIEGPGGAAKILGLHPNTLRSRMKKLGVRRAGNAAATK